jgi:hypothetical protein
MAPYQQSICGPDARAFPDRSPENPVMASKTPGPKNPDRADMWHTPRYLVAGLDWPENAGNQPFYSLDRHLEWLKKLSQHGPIPPRQHLGCQIRAIPVLPPPAEGG